MHDVASLMIENFTAIQSFTGLIIFGIMSIYSKKIIQNFEDHPKYSLVMFFINRKAINAFWVISVSAILFSLGLTLGNLGASLKIKTLQTISLFSFMLFFVGLGYFTIIINNVTSKSVKNDQIIEERD